MEQHTFRPAWWLRNGHAQTIWPSKIRRIALPQTSSERLELPDGDFLDLHWLHKNSERPVVIVLHGLGGSIHSHYIKGILPKLAASGFRVAFLSLRSSAGVINRTYKNYHAGETEDLRFVIEHIARSFPETKLAALGYSVGGSIVLNYLAKYGSASRVQAAVAVSVPYDLHETVRVLDSGFSRLYQHHVLSGLKKTAFTKYSKLSGFVDPRNILSVRNFFEYDELITAPLYGFRDARDYYAKCSARQRLKHIDVPTLLIHAQDDPFMTPASVPQLHELSSCVELDCSEQGGHVGFIAGESAGRPQYWLEKRIPEFFVREMRMTSGIETRSTRDSTERYAETCED